MKTRIKTYAALYEEYAFYEQVENYGGDWAEGTVIGWGFQLNKEDFYVNKVKDSGLNRLADLIHKVGNNASYRK